MEAVVKILKDWVLSWDFVRREMYSRVFKAATDDILETFNGDVEKRTEELALKKLNDLLSPVDLRAIVRLDAKHGVVYINGERVDQGRLSNLNAEAKFLMESDLWRLLTETPKELAQRRMFVAGESIDDMKAGRSILYTLSAQQNIVDTFLGYAQRSSVQS